MKSCGTPQVMTLKRYKPLPFQIWSEGKDSSHYRADLSTQGPFESINTNINFQLTIKLKAKFYANLV